MADGIRRVVLARFPSVPSGGFSEPMLALECGHLLSEPAGFQGNLVGCTRCQTVAAAIEEIESTSVSTYAEKHDHTISSSLDAARIACEAIARYNGRVIKPMGRAHKKEIDESNDMLHRVWEMVERGDSHRMIGQRLGIQPSNIKEYVERAKSAIGAQKVIERIKAERKS